MASAISKTKHSLEDALWQAVLARDPAADGAFVYSVRTTGVYCRPNCPARRARRENVRFHDSWQAAERAGFRACRRCHPTDTGPTDHHAALVTQACRRIESAEQTPSLAALAQSAGLSRFHFQRLFKSHTGITPKAYATAVRAGRVRSELARSATVTQAIYGAGFSSSSRFYESAAAVIGMTPKAVRAGGVDTQIRVAVSQCWLGAILVAATERGICAISLGDDPALLRRELQQRFPRAQFIDSDAAFEGVVATVVKYVESPSRAWDMPLDIQGTAFQQRVWQALRAIPAGTTTTYTELAAHLGQPKSVRAVASACAANAVAVAIPCHRVVRKSGSLAGYRWGVERKRELLHRERKEQVRQE